MASVVSATFLCACGTGGPEKEFDQFLQTTVFRRIGGRAERARGRKHKSKRKPDAQLLEPLRHFLEGDMLALPYFVNPKLPRGRKFLSQPRPSPWKNGVGRLRTHKRELFPDYSLHIPCL